MASTDYLHPAQFGKSSTFSVTATDPAGGAWSAHGQTSKEAGQRMGRLVASGALPRGSKIGAKVVGR